jgi:chloramphenicol 3-O-phosphotransferase
VASKKNNMSIGEALQEFISENKLQKGIDKVIVKEAWESLMGNGVNNYTTGVELQNNTLFVSLSSSVLREELSHGKSKIIAMLNEELGREVISKIVLR